MISVEKIQEGVRLEGLNYGLPTVFVKLGIGSIYLTVEELIRDILGPSRARWVCILGSNTTQVGLGTLIKGLSSTGFNTEVECWASVRAPGWLHSVDRWVIDYTKNPIFNLGGLRSADMVRFTVGEEEDLDFAEEGFKSLKLFSGTKYLKVTNKSLWTKAFRLARGYDRTRLYKEE